MTLAPGTKLGPYEILSPLGAGGMGEVWKAKDTRLDRLVAIKVLPEHLTSKADALARFEREAKAVAALNHPNILAIFDIGLHEGIVYAVMELLEGESLRQRLAHGPLTPRKATELAIQVASGLAAAHEKGVVHRDLKPDNLWIGKDGRLKILDFGLAKQMIMFASGSDSVMPTMGLAANEANRTEEGRILGTLGYMSPEQVRGEAVDARCDIFAFGAVLFEMLTGQRAFARNTAADTMACILKEDAPVIESSNRIVPQGLQRVLQHCLEKDPAHRFQDARDLAFALESLSSDSISSASFKAPPPPRWRKLPGIGVASVAVALLAAAAFGWAVRGAGRHEPTFQRLTFQRGTVENARFAPDGKTIVYSARWQGRSPALFTLQGEGPESRPLGLENASFLSISHSNELALQLSPRIWAGLHTGKLSRVPMGGGGTRDVQEDIHHADWNPVTGELAVILDINLRWRLESPPGKSLYEALRYLDHPRFSRRGGHIAFFEGSVGVSWTMFPEPGEIAVVDAAGKKRVLATATPCTGLAWAAKGEEVWYTECLDGSQTRLWGVTIEGKRRLIWGGAGFLSLQDIAPDGRLLMLSRQVQSGVLGLASTAQREQDLSIFDGSTAVDLSADGGTMLINEGGSGGGKGGSFFIRRSDGSPPVRLDKGSAVSLSPDGKQVLAALPGDKTHFHLIPTGSGTAREIPLPGFEDLGSAWFLPGGIHILIQGRRGSEATRHFLIDMEGGPPRPLTPEGTAQWQGQKCLSPDGRFLATNRDNGQGTFNEIFPVQGGKPFPVPGIEPNDTPICWSSDARALFVFNREGLPVRIYRLDLATGKKQLIKEFMPADPGGIAGITSIAMTGDAKTFAFNYRRRLSELFVVEGLK